MRGYLLLLAFVSIIIQWATIPMDLGGLQVLWNFSLGGIALSLFYFDKICNLLEAEKK